MGHIEVVRKAIEFKNPEYIPLEIVEVPGIYDEYGNVNPDEVTLLPGTQDFDALQATFSYVYEDMGKDEKGRPRRRSEWGFVEVVPESKYDYFIVEYPLADWDNLGNYQFPDVSVTDEYFNRMKKALKNYPERFITAYIDPGPFLTTTYIAGYEHLLTSLYTDLDKVKYLFDGIINYHMALVKRWKEVGAHLVSYFDEFAHQEGLLFSPKLWRDHFKPFYKKIFSFIHEQGMYTGCGLDGKTLEILPDMKEVGLDVLDCRQPTLMGIDNLAKICDGKLCIKSSIDMQSTLATGRPDDVFREAEELAKKLGGRGGGFIALVFKWAVLEYPEENIRASVEAFNRCRKGGI